MKAAWQKTLGLALVLVLAGVAPVLAQSKTFTGTIAEIARGTELDVLKHGNFYIVRLKEYPVNEFRLTPDEAVKFGVIKRAGGSPVLTPKMCPGLGWKVKLTAKLMGSGWSKSNSYRVLTLEKLGN